MIYIFFYVDIQLFQHYLLKRISFFPLNYFGICVKSVNHTCMYLFLESVCFSHWFEYLFVLQYHISPEIRQCKSFSFVLFHNCFGYFRVFAFPCKFYNHIVNFYRKACWALSWDYVESIDQFGEIDLATLRLLSLPVQHGVSVHLFRAYSFQYTGVTHLLLNLFIYHIFDAVVNCSFSNFNFQLSIDVIQKYKILSVYWPYILQPY